MIDPTGRVAQIVGDANFTETGARDNFRGGNSGKKKKGVKGIRGNLGGSLPQQPLKLTHHWSKWK